jgi:hypothetical protein
VKPVVKVWFSDFWANFIPVESYFFKLLSKVYRVELSDTPDILIYSCYGSEYLQYDCIRIFFSPENMRPDFTGCDFALTFDYIDDPRHFRLPLYGIYIDQHDALAGLLTRKSREQALEAWKKKPKFCCMVVSNGRGKKRNVFFDKISAHRKVDSGGRYLNNVGGPVPDKMKFIREYKFVIAFENSSCPGYTTEKILEPLIVDSIPVYWGDPQVGQGFNEKRFLNYDNFGSDELLIRKMLEIEANPEMAIEMLMEPNFPGNQVPACIDEKNVLAFLESIVLRKEMIIPIAKTGKRHIHFVRRKRKMIVHYVRTLLNLNFR